MATFAHRAWRQAVEAAWSDTTIQGAVLQKAQANYRRFVAQGDPEDEIATCIEMFSRMTLKEDTHGDDIPSEQTADLEDEISTCIEKLSCMTLKETTGDDSMPSEKAADEAPPSFSSIFLPGSHDSTYALMDRVNRRLQWTPPRLKQEKPPSTSSSLPTAPSFPAPPITPPTTPPKEQLPLTTSTQSTVSWLPVDPASPAVTSDPSEHSPESNLPATGNTECDDGMDEKWDPANPDVEMQNPSNESSITPHTTEITMPDIPPQQPTMASSTPMGASITNAGDATMLDVPAQQAPTAASLPVTTPCSDTEETTMSDAPNSVRSFTTAPRAIRLPYLAELQSNILLRECIHLFRRVEKGPMGGLLSIPAAKIAKTLEYMQKRLNERKHDDANYREDFTYNEVLKELRIKKDDLNKGQFYFYAMWVYQARVKAIQATELSLLRVEGVNLEEFPDRIREDAMVSHFLRITRTNVELAKSVVPTKSNQPVRVMTFEEIVQEVKKADVMFFQSMGHMENILTMENLYQRKAQLRNKAWAGEERVIRWLREVYGPTVIRAAPILVNSQAVKRGGSQTEAASKKRRGDDE